MHRKVYRRAAKDCQKGEGYEKLDVTMTTPVEQWNIEAYGKSLEEGTREVYKDEIYSILKTFNLLTGEHRHSDKPYGCKRILDAGCGYGRWVKALYDEGISVYGIDFARVGIISLSKAVPNVPLFIGDVRALPFKDNVFDVILSLGVMEHAEEGPLQIIKESFRCLKSQGTLVVSVPFLSLNRLLNPLVVLRRFASSVNPLRYLFRRGRKLFFQYEFSLNEFISYLRIAGFKPLFWSPIWVDFGVKNDFGVLSGLFYPIIKLFSHYPIVNKFIRYFFCAFIIFIAKRGDDFSK